MPLEFDHFNAARDGRAVVMPTDNAIAEFRVVFVLFEVAGAVLKLDSDSFLGIADVPICDTVRECGADRFNTELQFLRYRRE